MKHLELMQTYLANVHVLNMKLLNLHWNVVGPQFLRLHLLTEEIHDILDEHIDVVAEVLKMKEVYPLSTLAEYLEVATIEEVKAQDFTGEEVLKTMLADLETMRELTTEIRNLADDANDFEVVMEFEEYTAVFSKYIWFTKAFLA